MQVYVHPESLLTWKTRHKALKKSRVAKENFFSSQTTVEMAFFRVFSHTVGFHCRLKNTDNVILFLLVSNHFVSLDFTTGATWVTN